VASPTLEPRAGELGRPLRTIEIVPSESPVPEPHELPEPAEVEPEPVEEPAEARS
jgi:hypothetical protein